jgi:hypothetical protein
MNRDGHDDRFIDIYLFESLAGTSPFIFHQVPPFVQYDFPVNNIPKGAFAPTGHQRHKNRTR